MDNIWNRAKKAAYAAYKKVKDEKPATRALHIINNSLLSPLVSVMPYGS
jgi:hypothetical protein